MGVDGKNRATASCRLRRCEGLLSEGNLLALASPWSSGGCVVGYYKTRTCSEYCL